MFDNGLDFIEDETFPIVSANSSNPCDMIIAKISQNCLTINNGK